jgi:predicted nucleic acid-binding protein
VDINLMPAQVPALIDANIFIYHLGGLSSDCTDFLLRVARNEFESHVTTIVIAEVLHRRMLGEAVAKGLTSPGQALRKLKANSQLITQLTDYITDIQTILKLPLTIIEATASDIEASHSLRQSHGLFVNDSINLACAQRMGIEHIVTRDDDFTPVPGLRVWMPGDI